MRALTRHAALVYPTKQYFGVFRRDNLENRGTGGRRQIANQVLFDTTQAKKIQQTRNHFMGITLNTEYVKCYNEDSFSKQLQYKGRKISQLPFSGRQTSRRQNQLSVDGITAELLNKFSKEKLQPTFLKLSQQYFKDLINNTRNVLIQPNFDRQCRRTMSSLMNAGYKFERSQPNESYASINRVQLFKGVQVIRNNNYTSDSYNIEIGEDSKIKQYKLWTVQNVKLAEEQQKASRYMVMRFEVDVYNASNLKIRHINQEQVAFNTQNKYHTFIFEMDLRQPPNFSSFHLSPYDYLRAYRPNGTKFVITNVDSKNIYYPFTFDEKHKKNILINKLV